jgi:uroporphyrinogen decarboxylase
VDLASAGARIGGRVCLQGNLDPLFLQRATEAEVRAAVRACLASARSVPRFILSTGCEVPLDTPIDNVRAMVDEARRYFDLRPPV